jgi:cytochrome b subunit of formate dehydrogenase
MRSAPESREGEGTPTFFLRFRWTQRLEHLMVMIAFAVLITTGIPQRFSQESWARWLILNMGGIDQVRFIHRVFGFLFALTSFYHLARVSYDWFVRGLRPAAFVSFADLKDAVASLSYDIGISPKRPQFDRYNFRQKFTYWGLAFTGAIVLTSGFILMYPTLVTWVLPGQVVPAAKMAHGYQGLWALLGVLAWHLYSVHLAPGSFPLDTSIFTGHISKKRLMEEHPLEYQRLTSSRD